MSVKNGLIRLVAALALGGVACGGNDGDYADAGYQQSNLDRCLAMCDARFSDRTCGRSPGAYSSETALKFKRAAEDCGRACAEDVIKTESVRCFFEGGSCGTASRNFVCFDCTNHPNRCDYFPTYTDWTGVAP